MGSGDLTTGLVSVVVPVYNRASLVGRTLDSILGQTHAAVEVVAINDGSTDGSLAVLREYERRHGRERVLVVDQANAGQVRARNNGMRAARGAFIAFLDSDDTWAPTKLAKQIPLFTPGVGLVYCGIHEVDDHEVVHRTVLPEPEVRGRDAYRHLLVSNRMTGGTVVVTREALTRVGEFDERFRAAENWDLWIRVAREFSVAFVNEPLVNYLKHADNMSADPDRMLGATQMLLQKHMAERPDDPALWTTYAEAWAHYHYLAGVFHVDRGRYADARRSFAEARRFVPGYRDTSVRLARTYLGRTLNGLITRLSRSTRGA